MDLNQFPAGSYLDDPSVPSFDHDGPVTVMDAMCGVCAKGARWIAHADRKEDFRIIPMQSELGMRLLQHYGLDPDDPVSWLYIEDGRAFTSMEAMIRAGRRLGRASRMLVLLRVFPKAIQDGLYRQLARNRYRLAAAADLCAMPDPEVQKRLLR